MFLAFQTRDDLVGIFGHVLVDVLALLVVLIDMLGLAQCLVNVFLHEQVHAFLTVLHTSGGIDARSNLEDDVAHRDVAAAESTDVDDGFQAHTGILIENLQSVESENAVLINHRYHIGGNAHGAEVQQRNKPGEGNTIVLGKSLHKLEAHTATTELLERIGIVVALGVKNGHCGRHLLVGYMVVADDEVNTQRLGIGNFLDCLDATVKDDHQFHTCPMGIVQPFATDAVALIVAIRDIIVYIGIELL